MPPRPRVNPESIRTVNPSTWPQYPYDESPPTMALKLKAASSADDTDWFVFIKDEAPDGSERTITRGFLKASHRAIDKKKSTVWRPWHPHDKAAPIRPGEAYDYDIEIIPTCNLFQSGHRLRIEIASCDPATNLIYTHQPMPRVVTNTIQTGYGGSRLLVPFIPR